MYHCDARYVVASQGDFAADNNIVRVGVAGKHRVDIFSSNSLLKFV